MHVARKLLLLLVAAVMLIGTAAPAQADAATKRKPLSCAAAKAKAKKKPTAARKRAVKRACRKAVKRQARPSVPATPSTDSSVPAAPAAPSAPLITSALQDGVVDCANRERAAIGMAPLKLDAALTRAAQAHAADMATRGFFAHETPEGTSPWERIEAALLGALPFRSMGENIAKGFRSAEATCTGWMNSPGHRANILDPRFTLIGPGWVDGYAVQNFGDR